MRKISVIFAFVIVIILVRAAISEEQNTPFVADLFALNTFVTMRAYGGANAEQAIELAVERIKEIESKMSISIDTSDVYRINISAGVNAVEVSEDTLYVIKTALEFAELTNGLFDITIYPIARLWGIGTENARKPESHEIENLLPLVDYTKVVLDEKNLTVFLEEKGMGIDLGGIAKGFAADEVTRIFEEAGVKHAIINLGGSISTVGTRPGGGNWRIGVRNPRHKEGQREHIAIVDVNGLHVLSAGDYERFISSYYESTGVRYHHIFDPFTGYPAETGVMATTVVSESAIKSDALATAMLLSGVEKGADLLSSFEDYKGLLITNDKIVHLSGNIYDYLTITDPTYILKYEN